MRREKKSYALPAGADLLVEKVLEAINEDLGGAPWPPDHYHLVLKQEAIPLANALDRVQAIVHLQRALDNILSVTALMVLKRKGTYAQLGEAADMTKQRAHQRFPRPTPLAANRVAEQPPVSGP